jgi:large subunit ribosomal protein L23
MGLFDKTKKEDKQTKATAKVASPAMAKTKKSTSEKKKEVPEQKVSMKDLYDGGTSQTVSSASSKEKHVRKFANAYKVLVKPVITERAAHLGVINKYVFAVAKKANKIEIAKAVNEVYGIKPTKVNIISMSGKRVRYGKTRGQKKDWKKAVVTLPTGKTINLYEGV